MCAIHGTRHGTESVSQAPHRLHGEASRVALGKVRHLDTGLLWIQHHVIRRNLHIHKVAGSDNEREERHPRALTVVQDQGLSPGTENMHSNENMNDDEDNEVTQVEHVRACRVKLTLKDQLMKRAVCCIQDFLTCQGVPKKHSGSWKPLQCKQL